MASTAGTTADSTADSGETVPLSGSLVCFMKGRLQPLRSEMHSSRERAAQRVDLCFIMDT